MPIGDVPPVSHHAGGHVCPACGHCQTCGRGNRPIFPATPYNPHPWWEWPYWEFPPDYPRPYITYGKSDTSSDFKLHKEE